MIGVIIGTLILFLLVGVFTVVTLIFITADLTDEEKEEVFKNLTFRDYENF